MEKNKIVQLGILDEWNEEYQKLEEKTKRLLVKKKEKLKKSVVAELGL